MTSMWRLLRPKVDCSTCHNMTDTGMSETLKDVTSVAAKKQVTTCMRPVQTATSRLARGRVLWTAGSATTSVPHLEFAGKKK